MITSPALPLLTAILLALVFANPTAADQQSEQAAAGAADNSTMSLASLATEADLIAIAMVEDTDYAKTRRFPSKGSAWLRVLIPYKGGARGEIIEVAEQGLGEDKCYYPEVKMWQQEGPRFLLLLRRDPGKEGVYRGRAPACRLPVLVTDDNRYALRYPIPGIAIEDPSLVQTLTFSDPAAVVDASQFTRAQVDQLVNTMQAQVMPTDPLQPPQQNYVYTQGIPVTHIRQLLQLAAGNPP